jgi:acetolactate synthase-1/2/3 large subunit
VFPANHALHTGMGFGSYAVPAATESFRNCDAMLAVATRFSEIPTGSYGVSVPQALVHLDINEKVFHANYTARVALHGDAKAGLAALLQAVKLKLETPRDSGLLQNKIRQLKKEYRDEWFQHKTAGRVNPARFFAAARAQLAEDDFVVCDDGNHTFLCAELMPIHRSGHFISPTDFNAMGYCVPAAIGTKLANPDKQVLGIVGDGAFMMTCMELVTASRNQLGLVMTVFNDGELAQIAQAQSVPYNRKTCTTLSGLNVEGVALATGCEYIRLDDDDDIEGKLCHVLQIAAKGVPVILDVLVDYSKHTRFTNGILKTNLGRFEFPEKVRFISRAIKRRITG